jgi:hypothetical protein
MNKRTAYAVFERTILDLYEQKVLTVNLLDRIASQYRLVDIDSAGSQYLRTRDGKDLIQICIEVIDPTFPTFAKGSSEDNEEYWERELKKWEIIVRRRWGWQAYCAASPGRARGARDCTKADCVIPVENGARRFALVI